MIDLIAEIEEETETEIKPKAPRKYIVYLLNDDFTPMDFVVFLLHKIFGLDLQKSEALMLQIHHEGKAICGIYSKDIAQTKQQQVIQLASKAGHPLRCEIEAEEE